MSGFAMSSRMMMGFASEPLLGLGCLPLGKRLRSLGERRCNFIKNDDWLC